MRSKIEIVAHRGAHFGEKKKENTLEAFLWAIGLGCDYIETDVLQTEDGVLVCFHDREIDSQPVKNLSFKKLIRKTRRKGILLCPFRNYVELFPKIKLDIELKDTGFEGEVWKLIKDIPADRYVVKSFSAQAIRNMRSYSSEIRLGYLVGKEETIPEVAGLHEELNLEFVSPRITLLNAEFFEVANKLELEIWPWTLRKEEEFSILLNSQISAAITDIPKELKAFLQ